MAIADQFIQVAPDSTGKKMAAVPRTGSDDQVAYEEVVRTNAPELRELLELILIELRTISMQLEEMERKSIRGVVARDIMPDNTAYRR